jgi:hypothetical protein
LSDLATRLAAYVEQRLSDASDIREHRGLDEVALSEIRGLATAHHDARALLLALLDIGEHAVLLLLAHHRPHQVAGTRRIAVGNVRERGGDHLEAFLVARAR